MPSKKHAFAASASAEQKNESVRQIFERICKEHGVPVQVALGIASNESGMGKSNIAKNANNWFGIRYFKYGVNGKFYQTAGNGRFMAYENLSESVEDFCRFVKRYYPHLINKPVGQWKMYGYGSKKYQDPNYWTKFR